MTFPTTIVVSPAYGRDYTNKRDAIADWNSGKDFRYHGFNGNGTYINRADAIKTTAKTIQIRYKRMQSVTLIPNK